MLGKKLGSCRCSKELQISMSISMQAGFISDTFSWKRMGLAEVGGGGHRFKVRVVRALDPLSSGLI